MESPVQNRLDFDQIREKLAKTSGRVFWKSLEEVAESPEFEKWVSDEFPNRETMLQVDRRKMLKLMGASMLLAGLSGCRAPVWPNHKIAPYVNQPEEIVPGKALEFASAMPLDGFMYPVQVESHMGRPTKLDGNLKAGSMASTIHMQASVLDLYDPDRSSAPRTKAVAVSWDDFKGAAMPLMRQIKQQKGAGFAVLMEPTSSPSFRAQIEQMQRQMPEALFVEWCPNHRDGLYMGTAMVCGGPAEPIFDFAKAKVIVSLDADFMGAGPSQLANAAGWAAGRRKVDDQPESMNRLYALELTPSVTGAVADHKMPVSVGDLDRFARALASQFGLPVEAAEVKGDLAKWVTAVAADLRANQGAAVVVAGDHAPMTMHAVAAMLNQAIGAVTAGIVKYQTPVIGAAGKQTAGLSELVSRMSSGQVKFLAILGGNPVFSAPFAMEFGKALEKVEFSCHLSSHFDETSKLTTWHLPISHYLESWGDGMTADGRLALQQPLINPLYETRSGPELLAILDDKTQPGYDLLVNYWQGAGAFGGDFGTAWRRALSDGIVTLPAGVSKIATMNVAPTNVAALRPMRGDVEVIVRMDPTIHDGRWANNGWMQEMPKPLTTLTWDNAFLISPKLATKLGVDNFDHIRVAVGNGVVEGPCWVHLGQPENAVTVHVGGGRDIDGYIARGAGFNTYPLYSEAAGFGPVGGTVDKAAGKTTLAVTQHHHSMEGRDIVKSVTLEEFLNPHDDHKAHHYGPMSMYDMRDHQYDGPQWGMTIDLALCMGCHACVAACQAENNIAVVGKSDVVVGREMHWIRIDRYYGGREAVNNDRLDNPETQFMPVTCMQCEKAPCEPVCPVAATIHSNEGLNQMVYNRCVGTRYCSNNCPYKVRRFNYFNYNDRKYTEYPEYRDLKSLTLVRNPDVTVRGRGVMEKCTFCVQRINSARINAKNEFSKGRREKPEPKEGEVITACQAACPTNAIVFGNIVDKESAVSVEKAKKRNYELLPELNTRNRLTYLHMVKNPNKELETV